GPRVPNRVDGRSRSGGCSPSSDAPLGQPVMPNITWQEPQVLVDLLAMNLVADHNRMVLPGPRTIAVVSPWLSDVEIGLHAGPWHQQITVGEGTSASLQRMLSEYCKS